MGVLGNPKHELFAQALAEGKTADEAYQLAKYKANSGNASRLKGNESILQRVEELQQKAAERVMVSIESITKQFLEDRSCAREWEQAGAMVSATEKIGKLHGLFVDRSEVEQNSNVTITDMIDRPQRETRDEWIRRRNREIAAGLGSTARTTNGRHNGGLV